MTAGKYDAGFYDRDTVLTKQENNVFYVTFMDGMNPKDFYLIPKPKFTGSTSPKLNKAGHYRPALFMFKNILSAVII